MNWSSLGNSALVALLLAIGALAWSLQLKPELQVDASALATLPTEIDRYRGHGVPLESTVEAALQADFNIQRVYLWRDMVIWLYIGYYGTASGGRPEHTPRGCYTGAGWGIAATRTVLVAPENELRVKEYLVERSGERRLVHFWFRSNRRTGMLGGWDQNVDRFISRIRGGRADGALIRISTPIADDNIVSARGRLIGFAGQLDPLIAERWPLEFEAG